MTLSHNKPKPQVTKDHFITADITGPIDSGEGMNSIYPCSPTTEVLDVRNLSCSLAVNSYGQGRAVYMAGLPYSVDNTRLLSRAIFWVAGKEGEMMQWHSVNPAVECAAYPGAGQFVVINNSDTLQKSNIAKPDGSLVAVELPPLGYQWLEI